jgi:hypothetical protein
MTADEHAKQLGGLVGNFHSLEFILRAFLQQLPTARPIGIPHGADIYSFPVGTELPESELTSYDSLRELIEKFNREMGRRSLPGVDETLVEVRDALAHGRVSAADPSDTLRLLKFSKPQNGRVRITFGETMTAAWFQTQKQRVLDAIHAVAQDLGS